jgi:hypothetical protein
MRAASSFVNLNTISLIKPLALCRGFSEAIIIGVPKEKIIGLIIFYAVLIVQFQVVKVSVGSKKLRLKNKKT